MENTSNELAALVPEYAPVQTLLNESKYFLNPEHLHQELQAVIFKMLNDRENIFKLQSHYIHFISIFNVIKSNKGSFSIFYNFGRQ